MKRIKIHSAIKHLIALILKRRLYRKIRYPCDCAMPITLTNKKMVGKLICPPYSYFVEYKYSIYIQKFSTTVNTKLVHPSL